MRNICLAIGLIVSVSACSSKPPAESIADVDDGQVFDQREVSEFVSTTQAPQGILPEYYIGVGDHLDVVFFFHEDLTTQNLLVRTDGRITLPYVGDIMAAGNTPMGLDSLLTQQFSEILRDPNLSVIVREVPDQMVYVLGEVPHGGGFDFDRHITLVQALARAGGLDNGAKTNSVLVIRREGLNKIVGVQVDVKAILNGETISDDFMLRNYDIIYVPKTRLKSAAEFMTLVYDVIEPGANLLLRGWTLSLVQQQVDFRESAVGVE